MKMLQVLGLTLIVAAVFMHFSFCYWDDRFSRTRLFTVICAREEFKDNIAWAGVCGLVVPTLMLGGGVALALISHTKQKGKR